MNRPNILLILADQWRGTDQGWRGNADVRTPHLDRLAETGVAVSRAYANTPVCGPSRACLLTGQLPHRHRVVANDLPLGPGTPTVADMLIEHGYRTGWIGKWHLDGLPRDKWVPPQRRRGFTYWAGVNCVHDYFDAHYYTGDDPTPVHFTGYEPHVQTDLALRYLAGTDSRPFFLTVSYNPPHDPYEDVPAEYVDGYDSLSLTLRKNAADTPENRNRLRHYYAGITAVDEQVGRLVDGLDSLGLRSNTLVVVTSDHGDMLGSHGRSAKQVPFEESISVPLVFSWPDGLPSQDVGSGVFGLVDLAPTLLGMAGGPVLPDTYGIDLSSALAGGGPLRSAALLANVVSVDEGFRQGAGEWRGVRTDRYTYARHVDGNPWLLYDNDVDPWQQHDLVGDSRLTAELDQLLTDMLADAADVPAAAEATLRSLQLVDTWNARERELNRDHARVLPHLHEGSASA